MWTYKEDFSFPFWTCVKLLGIQLQEKITYIWQIEQVQMDMIKFEIMQFFF